MTSPSSPPMIDLSPEGDGSLVKVVKRAGPAADDKPLKGDKVWVHYVGTLADDGAQFDSSRDRDAKFTFTLGKSEVIKGWDLGVASMAKGELAVFTIKSQLAYGEDGSPPKIPPGATLNFEIELFDFEGEDLTKEKNKAVVKRILSAGEGLDHPNEDSQLEIEVKACLADDTSKTVDERTIKFVLGEGQELNLPPGVELALEKMKRKEKARVTLAPSQGFGAKGCAQLNIPPQARLVYEIKVVAFERAKESWQLDGEQKLEHAILLKDKGTKFFKQAKYEIAGKKYAKVIEFLEHEISLKDEKEVSRKQVLEAGRLNLAMCYLKSERWIEARDMCDKVLDENPKSEKAFFRRGEARMHLNDHNLAKLDFAKVIALEETNKAARHKILACNKAIKDQKAQEKRTFANMFDKFAEIDARREELARKNQAPLEINQWQKKNGKKNANESLKVSGDVNMDLDIGSEMDKMKD